MTPKGFGLINNNKTYSKPLTSDLDSTKQIIIPFADINLRVWTIATKNASTLAHDLSQKGYNAKAYGLFDYYKTMLFYSKKVFYKYYLLYCAPMETVTKLLTHAETKESDFMNSLSKDSDQAEELVLTSNIPFIKVCNLVGGPTVKQLVNHLLYIIPKMRSIGSLTLRGNSSKNKLMYTCDYPYNELINELMFPNASVDMVNEFYNEFFMYNTCFIEHSFHRSKPEELPKGLVKYMNHFECSEQLFSQNEQSLSYPLADKKEMVVIISRNTESVKEYLNSLNLTMNNIDQSFYNNSYSRLVFRFVPKLFGYLSLKFEILYKEITCLSIEKILKEVNTSFLEDPDDTRTDIFFIEGLSNAEYLIDNWNYQENEAVDLLSYFPFRKLCYFPDGPRLDTFINHFFKKRTQVIEEKREWCFNDFREIFPKDFETDFNVELQLYHNILNCSDWEFQPSTIKFWSQLEQEEHVFFDED